MFGNQHTQELPNKDQARKSLRAFLIGYTLLDMVFLIMFISMFSLSLSVFIKPDDVKLEDVLMYKKKLDTFDFSCIDQELYIENIKDIDIICKDYDTYIELEVFGYIFYAIKRE